MALVNGIFGLPPERLADNPPGAIQFSPLIPGAQALEACSPGSLASMVMLAPPGTAERRYAIALALQALEDDGELILMAPKDKGGSRLEGELESFGCPPESSGRSHYRICRCLKPRTLKGLEEALAQGRPQFLPNLGLWSQPGIFSWNRIDPGSALLVQNLPHLSGRGADFGCGLGILSRAVLASARVTQMTLIDLDRRAVDASRQNVSDPRASFLWADLVRDRLPVADLDFVVMNPPFHDGGVEDQSLGQMFIRKAAQTLRKGGTCWLTANRHLPYEAILKPLFRRVALRVEAGGYKVYEAQK